MRMRTSIGSTPCADEIQVVRMQRDAALVARVGLQVVHAVEAAQERALAAARRADQRRDLPVGDRDRQVLQRAMLAVVEVQILDRRLDVERAHLARVVDGDGDARRAGRSTGCAWTVGCRDSSLRTDTVVLVGSARFDACRCDSHASPVDLLAEAVANPDRHGVHEQRHAEQDRARGGGIRLERLDPDATPS